MSTPTTQLPASFLQHLSDLEAAYLRETDPIRRRFQYVYAVFDCVPRSAFGAFVEQLLSEAVAPGGRLILGAYGSRSRGEPPAPLHAMLGRAWLPCSGVNRGRDA
jgi:hypothetical protein